MLNRSVTSSLLFINRDGSMKKMTAHVTIEIMKGSEMRNLLRGFSLFLTFSTAITYLIHKNVTEAISMKLAEFVIMATALLFLDGRHVRQIHHNAHQNNGRRLRLIQMISGRLLRTILNSMRMVTECLSTIATLILSRTLVHGNFILFREL